MKIAILSDIHDHIDNLQRAIKNFPTNCEMIIFCGDMVAPSTAAILATAGLPTEAFLGNNEGDLIGLVQKGGAKTNWHKPAEVYGTIDIDKTRIAFCHYPKTANLLASSKEFDVVFYGHSHISKIEKVNATYLINPGAVCGINFEKNSYDKASFAIYDTVTQECQIIEI